MRFFRDSSVFESSANMHFKRSLNCVCQGSKVRPDFIYVRASLGFCCTHKDNTIFTLSIQTPQLLSILVLNFEQVQFTTRCCLKIAG